MAGNHLLPWRLGILSSSILNSDSTFHLDTSLRCTRGNTTPSSHHTVQWWWWCCCWLLIPSPPAGRPPVLLQRLRMRQTQLPKQPLNLPSVKIFQHILWCVRHMTTSTNHYSLQETGRSCGWVILTQESHTRYHSSGTAHYWYGLVESRQISCRSLLLTFVRYTK